MKLQNLVMFSTLPLASGNIIFDEVGTFAGAVSYTHLAINVDFTSIRASSASLSEALDRYEKRIDTKILKDPQFLTEGNKIGELSLQYNHTTYQLLENRRTKLRRLNRRLDDIQEALPKPAPNKRDTSQAQQLYRLATGPVGKTVLKGIKQLGDTNLMGVTTNIANILSRGIFGNFLSIFQPPQLGVIRTSFEKMISSFTSHDEYLRDNKRVIQDVDHSIHYTGYLQLLENESNFNLAFDAIESSLDDVATALQLAQQQRLAVELLPVPELKRVYKDLQAVAKKTNTELITTSPGHLFQLDTDFVSDGLDVVLLVHVPLIPPGTLSTLYKLRPFPIPITEGNLLIPQESLDLLAISNEVKDQWNTIPQAELTTCSKINNIHVCPGQNIMRREIESTCIGALYGKRIELVAQLCDMDVVPAHDIALSLSQDTYLIYALNGQDATLSCPGTKIENTRIDKGVSKHTIPDGCNLQMERMTIHAQFNLRLDSSVKYHEWDEKTVRQFEISIDDIETTRKGLAATRQGVVSLSEVYEKKKKWYERDSTRNLAIAALSAAFVFLSLCVTVFSVILKILRRNRNRHANLDAEIGQIQELRNFIEDKLRDVEKASLRIRTPNPPTSNPSSPNSSSNNLSDTIIQDRLEQLKNRNPEK